MTLTGLYVPNDEQVIVAWLRQYVGPDLGDAGIASSLPKDLPADGFVQARLVRAGIAIIDTPRHSPLVSLDFWAPTAGNGARPQWNLAAQLLARTTRAMENDFQTFGRLLDLGPKYMAARVQAVYKTNEPRRIEDDPSGYARYTLDVIVDWLVA